MEEFKVGDIIKERYSLIRFLGSGSFGEVWMARDILTNRDVAVKIYLSLDPTGIDEFKREYSNTLDISSPYLLTPEYFDTYNRRPFLVMKYCEKGTSSKFCGNIPEQMLWKYIEDVSNGLNVLHTLSDPIIHQDIKPDNILIDDNNHFLITDFGISKRLRATMRRFSKRDVNSGAMPYMAPERFESSPKLNTASDIWSLGASIYELAMGELPFSGFGGAMQRNGAEMPDISTKYSVELNSLMQRCLCLNPSNRPIAKELASWAKTKKVPIRSSFPSNRTQYSKPTFKEPSHDNKRPNYYKFIAFGIIAIIAILIFFSLNINKSSEKTELGSTNVDSLIVNNPVQLLNPQQQILSSPSVNQGNKVCHFYKGAFYYKNNIYPVLIAFINNNNNIINAYYKNVNYGSIIDMTYRNFGEEILLSGKDGNNNFSITLSSAEDERLVGNASEGNKTMTVRLMPTNETFQIKTLDSSTAISASNSSKYDINVIAKAFTSKYSDGSAPWSCLNTSGLKRLSNNLEEDNSPGGIFLVPFSAPLTINGKPIVSNQIGESIDWNIYLRGPNAGAMSLMFSTTPQYVDLNNIARNIASALNGSYTSKRNSSYSDDCVYLYNVGKLKLAIYCSFGTHGGSIEALLGDDYSVSEYVNKVLD